MTDALADVWAKSSPDPRKPGESLSAHTGWVLTRLKGWRERSPSLAARLDCAELWDLVGWACLLHDLGKSAPGFQAMLRGGPPFDHRHEVLSLVAVGWLDLPDEQLRLVAAGVATHHRDLSQIRQGYAFGSRDRAALLDQLAPDVAERWRAWILGDGRPSLEKLGFAPPPALLKTSREESLSRSMAALEGLAEEIEGRSATDVVSLRARAARGLVLLADHCASAHERLVDASLFNASEAVASQLSNGGRTLWPHQNECARADGSCLLIAPTGSGKTESALLWAARQRQTGPGRPPIFYMLPYRASLNAMRDRLPRDFDLADGAVVLQHSSATTSLYTWLLDKKGYSGERASLAARHERDLARLMTAPVRIVTPYQLLRAFFGLRGHEAVLTDAAGALLVLDELHAYDLDRLAIILCAVEHLVCDLGASVFAMSATFPRVLDQALRRIFPKPPLRITADEKTQRLFQRHVLRIADHDLLDRASLEDVQRRYLAGEAVLCVANTVARAQSLFDSLRAALGEESVALLHSRFIGRDRTRKELAIASRVGTGRRIGGGPGTVLCATQVVEVSLDVDFDCVHSDPAPVESLIQRFGRCNRGRRGGLRDVIVHGVLPDRDEVYERADVERTLHILTPHHDRPIEESMVQAWVDAAYDPIAAEWSARLNRKMDEVRAAVVMANRPLDSNDDLRKEFDRLFDGTEVVPARFESEYRRQEREEPLLAPLLRLPITEGQRRRLARTGRIRGEIVDLDYDGDRGLDLSFSDDA